MLKLGGYIIKEKLYENTNTIIYKAINGEDKIPVIIKMLSKENPTQKDEARFQLQFEIANNFNNDGIIKMYDLQKLNDKYVIIMEFFEGTPLNEVIIERKIFLEEFLHIAIKLTDAIGEIHRKNIIHMDITPENILWNKKTKTIKIIDFSISSKLSFESTELISPKVLEGSLSYISPEQTGRMNRVVDYRTDYYSLGITLYELITGKKPFETNDMLELIHSHIARLPISPKEKNPLIPNSVSDIIMKLIQKNAEDRYQSSFGINSDLKKALDDLNENGKVSEFTIGKNDISEKFDIPQKLYGRENEIKVLLEGFDKVCQDGNSRMLLVSGFAGIGKSALVHEIYKPILEKRGIFISGKAEQFSGDIPYLPIINAYSEFIRQILSESEEELNVWKNKILEAVGNNGQIIINVIPKLEVIIGKQPPIPALEPESAQNRFNMVFQKFTKAVATKEHPLVIFIDDMQWADSSTIKMIESSRAYDDINNMYFIIAYRDNELNNINSQFSYFNQKQMEHDFVKRIKLGPLNKEDVYELIMDTLKCNLVKAKELGDVCIKKTMGNPFFLNQLLRSLYHNKLIEFDKNNGFWNFDLEKIKEQSITDNVVELVVSNIQKLSDETQEILKIASVIGHNFDLKTLSIVNEKAKNETANELWDALKGGMIVPLDNNYKYIDKDINDIVSYKFLHDKVQQAAYSMMSEATKKQVHLKSGRLLLKNAWRDNSIDEQIFNIINHLNIAVDLITKNEEKQQLAYLNSIAGEKARNSIAYEMAIDYYNACINLLGKDGWKKNYDIMFEANIETMKLYFLISDYKSMKDMGNHIIENIDNILDKVKVNEIYIRALIAQSKMKEAVVEGIKVLEILGVNIRLNPGNPSVLKNFIKVKMMLKNKNVHELLTLPEMNDNKVRTIIRMLYIVEYPAHVTNRNLAGTIVMKMIMYSYKYGNTEYSTLGYSAFGAVLSSLGFIDDGYKFGKLGLDLAYKLNSKSNIVSSGFIYHTVSHIFKFHINESVKAHKDFSNLGIEIGNFEFGALNAMMYCAKAYFSGMKLESLDADMALYSSSLISLKQLPSLDNIKLYHQIVLNLLGQSEDPCILTGKIIDEENYIKSIKDRNLKTHICDMYLNKAILYYIFYDFDNAVKCSQKVYEYIDAVEGTYSIPCYYFYDSLSNLANYHNIQKQMQGTIIKNIINNQKKLKKLAKFAPMNYLHKYYLVEAEIAKIKNDEARAFKYYEKAIDIAEKYGFVQEQAIACERAAIYHISKENVRIAVTYLECAKNCYEKWGAHAKIKHLVKSYSHIIDFHKKYHTKIAKETSFESKDSIDLVSVIKASQAISEEIEYKNLIFKLIRVLIENAGAQKIIILKSKNEKFVIEAEYEITDLEPKIMEEEMDEYKVPLSLIKFVERTCESIVISEAEKSEFYNDVYVRAIKPKSIFCMPLFHQGKLNRILYFENNLAIGAFTSEKVKMINLLSAQMVISIENSELYQKAVFDSLTQVYNRGFLDNYLLNNVSKLQNNEKLSLLILDIDHFKRFNDTYGHQIGDEVLKEVAKTIEKAARSCDIVARYGGEEFVVVMPGIDVWEAKMYAENIRKSIEEDKVEYLIHNEKILLNVTVSIGVSELIDDDNRNTLIEKADKNLYIAKELGRNRVI